MSNPNLPESLIKSVQKNSLIPIIGAGVSMSIKDHNGNRVFPSWHELLEKAVEKLSRESVDAQAKLVPLFLEMKDYQQAAKYAHEGLQGSNWFEFLDEVFNVPINEIDESSTNLPKAIWGINNSVITLNFDRVMEWFYPGETRTVKSININSSAEISEFGKDSSKPQVWHLHGSLDDKDSLILTPDGYNKLYAVGDNSESQYKANLAKFQSISASKNFIFIGCSLSDAELLAEIQNQHKIFAQNTGPHFALVKDSDKGHVEELLKGTGIRLVTFKDYGESLENLINEIASHSALKSLNDSNSKTVELQKVDEEGTPKKTKIAVLIADPIDHPQNHTKLLKQIKKIRCTCEEFHLNIDNLNSLDDFDYLIILTKTIQDKLVIENEFIGSNRLSLSQLEQEIYSEKLSGVFIFTDKLLENVESDNFSLPIAIYETNDDSPLNGIDHKLFKKADINSIPKRKIINEVRFNLAAISDKKHFISNVVKLPLDIDQNAIKNIVGRHTDLENTSRKIVQVRDEGGILTIKGSGGLGKTTLVKKLAVEYSKRNMFAEGIHFVDCEYIQNLKQLEQRALNVFNLEYEEDFREHLYQNFKDADILIIFDNFETLLHIDDKDFILEFVSFISNYATIVITTREILGIDGEEVYDLRNLTTDEALKLFSQKCQIQSLSKSELKLLRQDILENLLENNPLAIKLIINTMPKGKNLFELRDELENDFFDKVKQVDIELFDSESDANIERKSSIYASILYSYQHLKVDEQKTFQLLSLFPDGIDLTNFKNVLNYAYKNNNPSFTKAVITDQQIKSLQDKSMIESNGYLLKLQSIIGKFADSELKKRADAKIYHRNALKYNLMLMSFIVMKYEYKNPKGLELFDRFKNNFIKSLSFCNDATIKNLNYMNYFKDVCTYCESTNSSGEFVKGSQEINIKFTVEEQKAFESLVIFSEYFNKGLFEDAYKKLLVLTPIDDLSRLYEERLKDRSNINLRISEVIARIIYEMEGELPIELIFKIKKRAQLWDEKLSTYDHTLLRLGEIYIDLVQFSKPNFFTFEAKLNLGIFEVEEIKTYLASLYKTEYLSILQTTYVLSKFEPQSTKTISRLITVNPYTKGLKKLMYAFVENDILNKKELFEEALFLLKHIKYYYIECIYFYAEFLQEIKSDEFNVWFSKGLELSKKHYYRFQQYRFENLIQPTEIEYNPQNYPLKELEKTNINGVEEI